MPSRRGDGESRGGGGRRGGFLWGLTPFMLLGEITFKKNATDETDRIINHVRLKTHTRTCVRACERRDVCGAVMSAGCVCLPES